MIKSFSKALLAYIMFNIIFTVFYIFSIFIAPKLFIILTPLLCSILIMALFLISTAKKEKKEDISKFWKSLNDSFLFSSAALIAFNKLSVRFGIDFISIIKEWISFSSEAYLLINLVLVTAAIAKAFIALVEAGSELIKK